MLNVSVSVKQRLNVSVLNMITGKNKSETLTKDISCKCKFDGKKCNSNQWWNNNTCRCECEKIYVCKKVYVWNPSKCICKNGKKISKYYE